MLYTEMVTAPAGIHGPKDRLLDYSAAEHPVALQLGGSVPSELAQATRIARGWGYDEINLNVGCPSDRVQSGCFGAVLMAVSYTHLRIGLSPLPRFMTRGALVRRLEIREKAYALYDQIYNVDNLSLIHI